MKYSKSLLFFAMSVALALFIAACGTNTTTGSNGGGRYGSGNTGQTPTTASMTLATATMTISGKSETILTTSQGKTLYYNTSDTATSSTCSGSCAGTWPPVLSTAIPTTSTTLPGSLTVATDENGSQVEYNGHPLYTFSGDTAPGQANGQGIGGVWFAAPTNLAAVTPAPGSTPTPGGYNGGY